MSFSSDNAQITNQLAKSINLPDMEDKADFIESIETLLKKVTDAVNGKEGGGYFLEEKGTGAQYYNKENENPLRNVYRKTFDLVSLSNGSIAGGATVQFPHEIENLVGSAGVQANCTAVDGVIFTASFPDVCFDGPSLIFINPHTQALSQCDVVANYLKQV